MIGTQFRRMLTGKICSPSFTQNTKRRSAHSGNTPEPAERRLALFASHHLRPDVHQGAASFDFSL